MNLTEMAKELSMSNPKNMPSDAPKIDEVAQIVLAGANFPTLFLRYRTEKKAMKIFASLKKDWAAGKGVVDIEGDMFSSAVDLTKIVSISLVVHRVRAKFVPFS